VLSWLLHTVSNDIPSGHFHKGVLQMSTMLREHQVLTELSVHSQLWHWDWFWNANGFRYQTSHQKEMNGRHTREPEPDWICDVFRIERV
jgi:hypothetical protein